MKIVTEMYIEDELWLALEFANEFILSLEKLVSSTIRTNYSSDCGKFIVHVEAKVGGQTS